MKLSLPAPRSSLMTGVFRLVLGGLFFVWFNWYQTGPIWAAQNQEPCKRGSNCTVGEFLYDDSYVPITTATCTLNLKTPSGTAYITNQSLTAASDGWYAHSFVPAGGDALGLYRGQICCTAGSDYLCLDKSVQLNDADVTPLTEAGVATAVWANSTRTLSSFGTLTTDVATAVWSAGTRTLSSFGTLTTDTATAVWSASGRTLSDFGSLVTDIWSNSTRTLTGFGTLAADTATAVWAASTRTLSGFGTLVADIWNNSTRTVTGGNVTATVDTSNLASKDDLKSATTSTATKTDVTDAKNSINTNVDEITTTNTSGLATKTDLDKLASLIFGSSTAVSTTNTTQVVTIQTINNQITEVRQSLEQLVNAPVVSTSFEGGSEPTILNLDTKLEESEKLADKYLDETETVAEKLDQLDRSWNQKSSKDLVTEIASLIDTFGSSDDNSNNSLFGLGNWLKKAWDNRLTQNLQTNTKDAVTALQDLNSELQFYGKTPTAKSLVGRIAKSLTGINLLVGVGQERNLPTTLYGYIDQIRQADKHLSELDQEISKLLEDWPGLSQKSRLAKADSLASAVEAINRLPRPQVLGATSELDERQLRNFVLSLQATVRLNRQALAAEAGAPLRNLWLEDGSVVFKAQITNPSPLVRQTVPLKFYLPKELKPEDIIETSEGITVDYDPTQESLYAHGTFTLAPSSTKVLYVETQDVWVISQKELDAIRTQAEELARPLEKTSFFGQGVLLRTDINTTLDKIAANQKDRETLTPEARIQRYREDQLELLGAKEKLLQLQMLVSQADSSRSVFGFVGGVQSVAVWGLILVTIAGFVFLTMYMRSITLASRVPRRSPTLTNLPPNTFVDHRPRSRDRTMKTAHLVFLVMAASSLSSLLVGGVMQLSKPRQILSLLSPVSELALAPSPTPTTLAAAKARPKDTSSQAILGLSESEVFILTPPKGGKAELKKGPDDASETLATVETALAAGLLEQKGDWSRVEIAGENDDLVQGWVKTAYLTHED